MFPVMDVNTNKIKYVGQSRAKVIDNLDPDARGRIRVDNPVIGETTWIPYLRLPFCYDVPVIGDVVYIQTDGGFETHPIAWGKFSDGENDSLPDVFKRSNPTNRGFYTPEGHLIELDDGSDALKTSSGIRVTTAGGTSISVEDRADRIEIATAFGDKLSVDSKEGIQASTPTGTSLSMKNGEVSLEASGTKIELKADSFYTKDVAGNTVISSPDSIEVKAVSGSKVVLSSTGVKVSDPSGAGLNIDSGKVALGGPAAEVVDILATFLQELSTDTFAGFGAPAGKAALYAQLNAKLQIIKGSL